MMFFLVVVYYKDKDSFTKGNKVFRGILLTAYLMQLVYLCIYICRKGEDYGSIYEGLYQVLSFVWVTLIYVYYGWVMVKGKLERTNDKIIQILYSVSFVLLGIFGLVCVISKWGGFADISLFQSDSCYMPIVWLWYLFFEFILLFIGRGRIKKEHYSHLGIVFVLQLVAFVWQVKFTDVPIFHIAVIIVAFYLYFALENPLKKELKMVKIERDYAVANTFSKSAFLKNLSHEIRTPINTIDGFSQVILESNNMKEIHEDVQDIRVASRELIDIINGMIDLSIIESGNLEIINENYNVYELVDNVIQIMQSKMRESSVAFHTDIEKGIPEVLLGDSERISQVVLSLLLYSLKYTNRGEICLRVDSVKSSSMCRLKVVVSDTGKGMKGEELRQLTIQGESSKLGLRVAKYLVELMGGKFEVDSVYEKGTTFTVIIDQRIVADKALGNSKIHKKIQPMDATGRRILLVDDNKLNLKVASKLLSPYHVEVVEANSGQECLDILDGDTNFDLILMDDLMPNMSGTETLSIIQKLERVDGYYIPIVVLTANAVSGMKEKYMEVGFDDYLSKPIERGELDRILRKYIKKKDE